MRIPRRSLLGGIGAALAFAALLSLLAIVLAGAHSRARRTLEMSFAAGAKTTAALTDALFETSAVTAQQTDAKLYGGARVPSATLTAAVRQARGVDMMLLAADGRLLAASAGTPRSVSSEVEGFPDYVRAALKGQPFSLSNVMALRPGASVIQYAQPFPTAFGRRVLVMGFAPHLLSGFISGYLAGAVTTPGSRAFVLDGNGVPIAIATHDRTPPPQRAAEALERAIRVRAEGPLPGGRFFAAAAVNHTPWRVAVTVPQSRLFASVSGANEWLPWILFGAFGGVLALVLLLGARALRNAAAQRERDAWFRAVASERLGLAAITETMAEGVVVTRASDLTIVYTNPTFEAMLGYEPGELKGQSVERVKPHYRQEHLHGVIAGSLESSGTWRGEVHIERKDGSLLWCLSNVATLEHPEHGTVWIAVNTDISDRKRIESELGRATAQAIEASRAKSQFVANMSHEIRTPLNGVIGMTDLLRETSLDPVQRGYVDALATSAEALFALINDVLDFSKIEAGRLELDPTEFELRPLIEEACGMLAEQAYAKGLAVSQSVDPHVPVTVTGDRSRLRQVLLNLISNAVKFTDRGEVCVHVVRDRAEQLRFAVSDTGVGIQAERAARLFDAFVQADQSTTRQYGGTGLGLAISSQLVRLMDGEIGVEPRQGGGSTFWFTARLPEVASAARPQRALDTPARSAPETEQLTQTISRISGPVVLIAEDNDINLALARAHLHKRGLQTAVARNGREAVEMAGAHRYAAILMDCQMPELDGYEATRQIRGNENGRRVPIIAMTAHSMSGDRERCLAAGMDDYLPKPIRTDQLEDVIKRWLTAEHAPAEASGERQGTGDDEGSSAHNGERVLDEATVSQLKQTLPPPMRGRLLETFDGQLETCLEGIAEAIRRDDGEERRRLAHLLKGSSATIGAVRLRASCEQLERSGRAGDPVVGDAELAELRARAAEAQKELAQQLR